MSVEVTVVPQCRVGLAPTANLRGRLALIRRQWESVVVGALGGSDRIPFVAGGDDGLSLGGGEFVVLPADPASTSRSSPSTITRPSYAFASPQTASNEVAVPCGMRRFSLVQTSKRRAGHWAPPGLLTTDPATAALPVPTPSPKRSPNLGSNGIIPDVVARTDPAAALR